ncbi:hypothetical protein Zmor_019942 [Zophobas morio]|uniref:Gustatory receptor n=1 Tax=Zophobas morio TaxID=2755281 RepID=A0AA38I2G3_9CUCU|nr:hypothetical protein Zmor_019942 [Zophobas morio]
MNFNRASGNFNSIKPLYYYLNLFLITPWYDFDKNSFRNTNFSRFYGCILIMVKIFWIFDVTVNSDLTKHFRIDAVSLKVASSIWTLTMLVRTVITVSKSTFWNLTKWNVLIDNFKNIDKRLQIPDRETSIFKNFYFRLFIRHVVIVVFYGFSCYSFSSFLKISLFKGLWVGSLTDMYQEFLLVVLINVLIECFTRRYKYLNTKLLQHYEQFTVRDYKHMGEVYRILGETVSTFSDLFGHQIICVLLKFCVETISGLNYMFIIVLTTEDKVFYQLLTANLLALLLAIWNVLVLIFPMDSATKEAKKFIDLCYKIQAQLNENSKEGEALTKLINCSHNFQRSFHAAGFFFINKGIIFSLVGNVATYYIIMIQLNENQYQKCG